MLAPVLSAAVLGLSPALVPQDPPPSPPPPQTEAATTRLSDVVTEGGRLQEEIRGFVDEVSDPLPGYGPARWDSRVCVGVAFLRRELAQYMVSRVNAVVRQVGLEPGNAGCRPNVLVIAAADGPEMARALVEARPGLFLTNVSGANRSRAGLEAFQASESPIRWWHVSLPVDSETGQAAVRLPGRPRSEAGDYASRLRTRIQSDLQRVFVVIDIDRVAGKTIGQLSDYVAMIALAQVDPEADALAYDTVLNLFAEPSPPPGMTDWDLAYMRALYGAELDQRNPDAQLEAVARVMLRRAREADQPDR